VHRGGGGLRGSDAASLTGSLALRVALAGWGAAAVLAIVAPARAWARPWARRAMAVAAGCLSAAVLALGAALVRGDWSLTPIGNQAFAALARDPYFSFRSS
jgi:hypothetical protein